MAGGSSRRYPPELRERALRMVAEISGQHDSEWAAISEVARLLGVGCAETVRKWVRQAQVDRRPYTVDGFKLGKWVATQRGSHGKGALDADRRAGSRSCPAGHGRLRRARRNECITETVVASSDYSGSSSRPELPAGPPTLRRHAAAPASAPPRAVCSSRTTARSRHGM